MPIGICLVAGRSRDQHLLKMSEILSGPLMANGGWEEALGRVGEARPVTHN